VYVTQQKEEFSVAYVHAIASVAGFALERYKVDNDSADVVIRSDLEYDGYDQPRVEIQVKSTAKLVERKGVLTYDVPANNYQALRSPKRHCPLYLVVVHVPDVATDWMRQVRRNLAHMRNCAYYAELHGEPVKENSQTVRVKIPSTQIFGPDVLTRWIERVGNGDYL
jgi:hypothetical protein